MQSPRHTGAQNKLREELEEAYLKPAKLLVEKLLPPKLPSTLLVPVTASYRNASNMNEGQVSPVGNQEGDFTQERKSSLNIKFLGGISHGCPSGYPPGPKTFTPSLGAQENKAFCADVLDPKARTCMTRGGLRKPFIGKFRADSCFPIYRDRPEETNKGVRQRP